VPGVWAYRVRPLKLDGSGDGGHGHDALSRRTEHFFQQGDAVVVEFFGEEISSKNGFYVGQAA
jgi:hypothetical protein